MSALLLLLAEAEGSEDLELLVGEDVVDLLLLLRRLPVVCNINNKGGHEAMHEATVSWCELE